MRIATYDRETGQFFTKKISVLTHQSSEANCSIDVK